MRVHVRRIASPAIFHQNIQHAMRHRVEIDAVGLHDSLFFPELRAQIRVWHKVKCMKQEEIRNAFGSDLQRLATLESQRRNENQGPDQRDACVHKRLR